MDRFRSIREPTSFAEVGSLPEQSSVLLTLTYCAHALRACLDYVKSLRVTPPTLAETDMTIPMRKLFATSHRGILKTRNYATTCMPKTTPKDGIDIPDKDDRAPVQVLRQRLKSEHADDLAEASHEALR